MPPAETANRDEPTGLSSSRADFATSLSRRLDSVLGALTALEQQPESPGRRDNFLRRVHALGASAKVLGFAAAAEIFARAEQQIRTAQLETLADDALAVRHYLSELPNLVLRGAYSLVPQSHAPSESQAPPLITEPLAIVVWGTPKFVDTLRSLDRSGSALEITAVEEPEKLKEICVALGPDLLLLDANRGSITLLVDELSQTPEVAEVAILVANVPEGAATGLRELGVRIVLPSRFTEQQLARALVQARHVSNERPPSPAPIGEVTLKELAERLAQEIREGLVDAAEPTSQLERLDLANGTPIRAAIWSALAQIRDQLVESSEGRIRFVSGPEGGVPLAPQGTRSTSTRDRADVESVDLSGRRILVVDDDPAVAWLVSGTLRAAGAVVTEALDGIQALQIAYRIWPELIVSDVIMPGLDGFALCHAVKRDVLLRDVPIVLLSWKEDLLFRLRDLGADADGYLRKEASASTIVRRVKELLLPRCALERRLQGDRETRGRLDGTTTRLLLELASGLQRPVRIALRDATGLFDIRLRHGSLLSVTRTRHDGTVEQGRPVLRSMLAISAGRFSVVTDHEDCAAMFSGTLQEVLAPAVLRARAAQRLLSGPQLGRIESLTLEPDAFGRELPSLPLSLRPIADELERGTPPRQLLASGVASAQLLESLLSDVARRGAVRTVIDAQGEDLLEREIEQLTTSPSVIPPKPTKSPPPLFTFQLSPLPPDSREVRAVTSATPTAVVAGGSEPRIATAADPANANAITTAGDPSAASSGESTHARSQGTTAETAVPAARRSSSRAPAGESMRSAPSLSAAAPAHPLSKAPPTDDIDWAIELSWDSTPPPLGSRDTAAADPFEGRPPTSGGFMRPAIATLERRAHDATPDLANAVVRAVSEATPAGPGTLGVTSLPSDPSSDAPTSQHLVEAGPGVSPAQARVDSGTVRTASVSRAAADVASTTIRGSKSLGTGPTEPPQTASTTTAVEVLPHGASPQPVQEGTVATRETVAVDPRSSALAASPPIEPRPVIDLAMAVPGSPAHPIGSFAEDTAGPSFGRAIAAPMLPSEATSNLGGSTTPEPKRGERSTHELRLGESASTEPRPHESLPSEEHHASGGTPGSRAAGAFPSSEDAPPLIPQEVRSPTDAPFLATAAPKMLSVATADNALTLDTDAPTAPPLTDPTKVQLAAMDAAPPLPNGARETNGFSLDHRSATPPLALGTAFDRPPFAESPTALPVVQKPPRPNAEPVLGRSKELPLGGDRDGEEPVFPLVSTANVPVDVQASIEVDATQPPPSPSSVDGIGPNATTTAAAPPVDANSSGQQTTDHRDTLRSPSDTLLDSQKHSFDAAVAVVPPARKAAQDGGAPPSITNAPPQSKAPEPSGSNEPEGLSSSPPRSGPPKAPSSSPKSSVPPGHQYRPVGWIQALGLAALAGIVTFAVTVPIAGWIRKQQEPIQTPPPVATGVIPAEASSLSLGSNEPIPEENQSGRTPAAGSGAMASETTPDLSAAPSPSAKVEEIPIPADVALQPGQALIEVSTGGGHAIFLDDSFVGRGPLRVIPVQPGEHVIRTRLNGVERTDTVDVSAGRSVRVSLEQTWK